MNNFFIKYKPIKSGLIYFISLLLIACQAQQDKSESRGQDEDKTIDSLLMSELKASDKMEFISHREVTFQLALSEPPAARGFLSLYTDFQYKDGHWQIDYDSRILAIQLQQYYNVQLSIPQHHTKILMQLWPYQTDQQPVTTELDIDYIMTISELE